MTKRIAALIVLLAFAIIIATCTIIAALYDWYERHTRRQ